MIEHDGRNAASREQRSLVVGASGFIGHILWRRLAGHERLGTYCQHEQAGLVRLDVRDAYETLKLVREFRPSTIYMLAAEPSADTCERNPEECAAVTVEGAAAVARAARDAGALLVYFSTDYVFDGSAGPYTENDAAYPINAYGRAKFAAEERIRQTLDSSLIVRPSGVYGYEPRGRNFVMALLGRLARGDSVRVPNDQMGTPTNVDDLVDAVVTLVGKQQRGTFHLAGPDVMDRYRFACLIADVFALNRALVVPVSTRELAQAAVRPLKAGLRTEKAQRCLGRVFRSPEAGLRAMQPALTSAGWMGAQ